MATKKAGSAGRFGARYSGRIRHRISEIEKRSRGKYECPMCHKKSVKRVFIGVWKCNKCGHNFAGRAYSPK